MANNSNQLSSSLEVLSGIALGNIFEKLTSLSVVPRPSIWYPRVSRMAGGFTQPAELTRNDLRFARAGTAVWTCRNAPTLFAAIGNNLLKRDDLGSLDPLILMKLLVDFLKTETPDASTRDQAGFLSQIMIASGIGLIADDATWQRFFRSVALAQADTPDSSISALVRWAVEVEIDQPGCLPEDLGRSLEMALSDCDGVSGFDLNRWAYFLLRLDLYTAATPLSQRALSMAGRPEFFPERLRPNVSESDRVSNIAACKDTYGWALSYHRRYIEAKALLTSALQSLAPGSEDWCEVQYHRTHVAFWSGDQAAIQETLQAMKDQAPSNQWTKRAVDLVTDTGMPAHQVRYEYDVVISYASEDRAIAFALADNLESNGVTVFYDNFERAALWGQNLYEYLTDLYQNRGRYCVVLVSKAYSTKTWTQLEWRAVQARCLRQSSPYCLPVRIDETQLPGLLPITAFLSLMNCSIDEIAAEVKRLLKGPSEARLAHHIQ